MRVFEFITVKSVKFAFIPPFTESELLFFCRFNQNILVHNGLQILWINVKDDSLKSPEPLSHERNDSLDLGKDGSHGRHR